MDIPWLDEKETAAELKQADRILEQEIRQHFFCPYKVRKREAWVFDTGHEINGLRVYSYWRKYAPHIIRLSHTTNIEWNSARFPRLQGKGKPRRMFVDHHDLRAPHTSLEISFYNIVIDIPAWLTSHAKDIAVLLGQPLNYYWWTAGSWPEYEAARERYDKPRPRRQSE